MIPARCPKSLIRGPLQRSSVRDILDPPSIPNLMIQDSTPASWIFRFRPSGIYIRILLAVESMQIRRRLHGDSTEPPRRFHGGPPSLQVTLRRSRDLQDTLGGSWDLPEAASDHHNTFSQGSGTFRQGPGTFRAVFEGSGTFREQRQTTGNEPKMIEIMKIVGIGPRRLEMG